MQGSSLPIDDPQLLKSYYLYDFGASVFTNAVVLMPELITALAKADGSPWGERYASPDCIVCADDMFNPKGLSLNESATACNGMSDDRCGFNATSGWCEDAGDTCKPTTANRCCTKDPSNITVGFFGAKVNYASAFAYCITISVVMQVLFFVVLGPLADFEHYHRRIIRWATVIGAVSTFCVTFTAESAWEVPALLFVVGNVAYGIADVAYNGYLSKLTSPSNYDRVGAKGFLFGQLGGQLCLLLSFIPIMIMTDSCLWGLTIALGMAGVWWAVFSSEFCLSVPSPRGKHMPEKSSALAIGLGETKTLWDSTKEYPQIGRFLLSYFIYSDGYSTITDVSAVYTSQRLCFPFEGLLMLILITEFTSAIGAYCFAFLVDTGRARIRNVMMFNLVCIGILPFLALPGVPIFSSEHQWTFLLVACVFGINLGSIHTLSRSMFARLIPQDRELQLFSMYEITNKGTSWLGPLVFALVNDYTGSLDWSYFSVFFFFLIGGVLLLRVDEVEGAKDSGRADADGELYTGKTGAAKVAPQVAT